MWQDSVVMVKELFRDKELTEFIIATIPTVLGINESRRLLQALRKEQIPCRRIIINQVMLLISHTAWVQQIAQACTNFVLSACPTFEVFCFLHVQQHQVLPITALSHHILFLQVCFLHTCLALHHVSFNNYHGVQHAVCAKKHLSLL